VPSFALKLMFGEASMVMTTGQRAIPARAQELGFTHRFSALRPALEDILR
jgi:NAD dependent epimerase/dehydratase family enzyme